MITAGGEGDTPAPLSASAPISTDFTVQGRLTDAGSAYSGQASIRVRLFDAPTGGTQRCFDTINGVTVVQGLFSVRVEGCSPEALGNSNRWLEFEVDTGSGFTTLTPRMRLESTPYSAATRGLSVDSELNVTATNTLRLINGLRRVEMRSNDETFQIFGQNSLGGSTFDVINPDQGGLFRAKGRSGFTVAAIGQPSFGSTETGMLELFNRDGSPVVRLYADGDLFGTFGGTGDGFIELASASDEGVGGQMWLNVRGSGTVPGIDLRGGGTPFGGQILVNDAAGVSQIDLRALPNGGRIDGYSAAGGLTLYMDQDSSAGGGGFLRVGRNASGASGLVVDGNIAGSESTRVSIIGSQGSIIVDTSSLIENNRVILPNNAIFSAEIGDEPGVVNEDMSSASIAFGGVPLNMLSATINAPAPGFVMALATTEVQYFKSTVALDSEIVLGVTNTGTTLPANGRFSIRIPGPTASGTHRHIATVHSIVPVPAGASTFNLVASRTADASSGISSVRLNDTQLSLLYFPTAYGTVSPTVIGARPHGPANDGASPARGPMTAPEIEASRLASIEADNARMRAELDAYHAQMTEIMAKLQAIEHEQAGRDPAPLVSDPQRPGAATLSTPAPRD